MIEEKGLQVREEYRSKRGKAVSPFDVKSSREMKTYKKGDKVGTVFPGKSKTQQGLAKTVELKRVLKNSGVIPTVNKQPIYGDFTEFPDLSRAIEIAEKANNAFLELPASVRAKFNNSPAEMSKWILKPENLEEARELGIVVQKQKPFERRMLGRIARSLENKQETAKEK